MTRRSRSLDRTPALRLAGPEALLEAVPYLLGFHPAASLVLVGLDRSALRVTVRLDLADLARDAVPDAGALLRDTLAAVLRGGAGSLVAVVYAEPEQAGPSWRRLAETLLAEADRAGCEVLDVLAVADGRWWSYGCGDPVCCPPAGRPVPGGAGEVAAAATYAGLVALPDRQALEATLDPVSERDRLRPAVERAEQAASRFAAEGRTERHERAVKRAIFAAARAADAGAQPCTEEELAAFGVGLAGIAVRDPVWMAVDDGRLDGRALWLQLARQLPAPYDAAPLFLVAWCAWRAGNGALAGIAAERALRSDPGYSAAELLQAALARGVDPRRLPTLRPARPA